MFKDSYRQASKNTGLHRANHDVLAKIFSK
jgi:hypothetical protein